MILTEKQEAILVALARFKFLTTSQLIRLGIDKHRPNLSKALSTIKGGGRPLVKTLDFGLMPQKGRVESLYYLTKQGADLVHDQLGVQQVKYPRSRNIALTSDYFHRVATIDCEIALSQCNEVKEIVFSHRYFDQAGSNRTGNQEIETKIFLQEGELIADWVFMIRTVQQTELYCAEIFMDERDANRPYQSLRKYIEAIVEGAPSIKYQFNRSNRVLAIFSTERTMFSVLKRIQQDPSFNGFEKHFQFKCLSNVGGDFRKSWIDVRGKEILLQ